MYMNAIIQVFSNISSIDKKFLKVIKIENKFYDFNIVNCYILHEK